MTRICCLFFILLFSSILEAEELPKGGQKVEQVQIEQLETKEIKQAKELLKIQEPERESSLTRGAMVSDVVGERPNPKGTPTQVKIGVYVTDIMRIDDNRQNFTANVRLSARWIDPRLADPTSDEVRKVPLEEIWNPLLLLMNQENVAKQFTESAFLDPDGYVFYAQRYIGTFTVPLNLKNFPLDQHQLYIDTFSYFSPEEVSFIIDESMTGWSETLSIPDWIVSNGGIKVKTIENPELKKDISQIIFSFTIQRRLGFYFWKIIIPLSLIVIMSWGVFWIDPSRLEAQIGLSATTFLTLFAFQFAIAALLPKIAYLTRMDRFTMSCSILVFLALVEAVTTSYFVKKNELDKAAKLDSFSRWAFPITFAGAWYLAFWF